MQNGGYDYDPRPSTAPFGAYGNGGWAGFRGGPNAPPHRQPPPPHHHHHHQMTPQRREEVLMEAGRLAAEYLVAKGELPLHALRNRPPAPLPFQEGPSPPPFQERPLARQHFRFLPRGFARPSFAPRPVQGRPIAKRPRLPAPGRFQGRPPFHSGARGPAPPAAPVGSVTTQSQSQGSLNDATAGIGNGDSSLPVTQPPRTME